MYKEILIAPRNETDDTGLIKIAPDISCSVIIDSGKIVNSSSKEYICFLEVIKKKILALNIETVEKNHFPIYDTMECNSEARK